MIVSNYQIYNILTEYLSKNLRLILFWSNSPETSTNSNGDKHSYNNSPTEEKKNQIKSQLVFMM